MLLNGPAGRANRYRLLARGPVWALPRTPLGLVRQVAAALATGNPCHVVLPAQDNGCAAAWQALRAAAGDAGVAWLHSADDQSWGDAQAPITALLFEGDGDALVGITTAVAARAGAIVRVESRSSEALHAGARLRPGRLAARAIHQHQHGCGRGQCPVDDHGLTRATPPSFGQPLARCVRAGFSVLKNAGFRLLCKRC